MFKANLAQKRNYRYRQFLAIPKPDVRYLFDVHPSLTGHGAFTGCPDTPDLDLTRATHARVDDADGYVRRVYNGEPRFRGAIHRTNLLARSNLFSNATWIKLGVTTAQNPAIEPPLSDSEYEGQVWEWTEDTSTGEHRMYNSYVAVNGEQGHVGSIYVKYAGTTTHVGFGVGGGLPLLGKLDLRTGDISGEVGVGIAVSNAGNGWWRISSRNNGGTVISVTLKMLENGTLNSSYTGSTSNSIYVFGGQMEEVFPKTTETPGPYIDTTNITTAKTQWEGPNEGIVIEPTRTNILLQSQDLSTTWAASSATINTDSTTAPDGSPTADEIEGSGGGTGAVAVTQGVTVAASTRYAYSVFVKADASDWVALSTVNFTTPANSWSYFDLANGVVGTKAAGHDSIGIKAYADGWYRCWITFTTDAVDTFGTMGIYVADGDNDNAVLKTDANSIFAWGTQLEVGDAPTTYIPTTTGTATRNFDNISTQEVDWFSSLGGTWYTQTTVPYDIDDHDQMLWNVGQNTTVKWSLYHKSPANASMYHSATSGGLTTVPTAPGEVRRTAVTAVENDLAGYGNGVAGTTDASFTPDFSSINIFRIGNIAAGTIALTGTMAELAYWKGRRLSNDRLEALSNYGPDR